ncbi:TIGR02452 family protein [Adlercreutzia sp. R21]|uniref:TIGR02452 family protein n=1 Tax=Adlercreutzia wanghongyangiae TaxID=3111451 RepID=UPI002DB84CF3|nr:TIGR02452 family protein [Adlercreutzia sp. R21]MEC4185061.1 TIGR02452 family protein [Adlercreutzia sp. R21]
MAEFSERGGARRPNRDEVREERRREAARHTGLMKAAFGTETDEAIAAARIYEEGEGRTLLWGVEAAEAAKAAAEMAEADADGAQVGDEEAREEAEIAEEAAEEAEAAAGAEERPAATKTTVKVVTSFAPEALYRDAAGKTMIVDPGTFTRPGGAYEDGAFGPEQILCSESNLYPVLCAHKRDFYDKNRDYRRGSLFTDRALYVPDVLFSRGGDTRRADVLVIAEPVRAFALENHRSERECDKALADRIETIFRVAAANDAETLIMGAFGCGRNGYPVQQVIELARGWIADHPGAVPQVVFAVPRMHADAFREAFGAPEPEKPAAVVRVEPEDDEEREDWRDVQLPEGITLR